MSDRNWHKGPPPHMGWWMTKRQETNKVAWRWWNGSAWSVFCDEDESPETAARWVDWSSFPFTENEIEWNDYWPKNARVPRIDPREVA